MPLIDPFETYIRGRAQALGVALPSYTSDDNYDLFRQWAERVALIDEIEARGLYLRSERDEANRLALVQPFFMVT